MKLKLCGEAGCNKLVVDGGYYCPEHKIKHDKERKASAFKNATRFANYHSPEWIKFRGEVLKKQKCCEKCGTTKGLQVHHIIPVRYAPELFLRRENVMVLCADCHKSETAREIRERKG